MAILLQPRQQFVQKYEFARRLSEEIAFFDRFRFFLPQILLHAIQKKQVVAAFSQLHGQIV